MAGRMLYPFFHANVFHAAINALVFCQCCKVCPCKLSLVVFYLIAISYPFHSTMPIVGLSGITYAYLGYLIPLMRHKVRYTMCVCVYLSLGILFPNIAVGLHIYCYALGLLWGFLTLPLCQDK